MQPQLKIEQKITAFVNRYKILSPDGAQLLAMAQQKRLAFKEKVTFYSDEQRTQPVFGFRAEKVMDIHGRYFVEDANGVMIGGFRKEFKKSLLRSSWILLDAQGNDVVRMQESSEVLAILRRFIGWAPLIGDLLELIVMFFKYHFQIISLDGTRELGQYKKVTLFRDHYMMETTDELRNTVDWRVLAAMGVALDAMQSR